MIVLASGSATRQAILGNAGVPFTIELPRVDERQVAAAHPQWTAAETAMGLAQAKAIDVSLRHPQAVVIGADQVLACDGAVYYKPADIADCRRQLLALRGRSHMLISAVASARGGTLQWQHSQTATLRMRAFQETYLETYLERQAQHIMGAVGGYQIETEGIQLFDAIAGDHFTILGLPLMPLLHHLRAVGELPS